MERKIIFFVLFHLHIQKIMVKAPVFNKEIYLSRNKKNDSKNVVPESFLETIWRKAGKDVKKNLLFEHTKHMFCLGCYQNIIDHSNVPLILGELKDENEKQNFADGLLIKYFVKKGAFSQLHNLPIFQRDFCEEDLLNLDRESSLCLMHALCFLKRTETMNRMVTIMEKKFPDEEQALYQILLYKLELGDIEYVQSKLNLFLSSATLRTKHIPFILLKSFILIKQENFSEALKTVNLGLELQPYHEKLLQQKISLLSSLNLNSELVSSFQKLSEVSRDPQIKKYLINFYLQTNKLEEALSQLMLLEENSIQVFFDKITLQSKLDKYCDAWETFRRFLVFNKKSEKRVPNRDLKKLKYSLLFQAKKYELLLENLFKDLSKNNFNEVIFFNMLKIAKKSNLKASFIRDCRCLFENREELVFMKLALANFCEEEGFFVDALDLYDNLLAKDATHNKKLKSSILVSKAKTLLNVGEKTESKKLLVYIIKTYPETESAINLLAELECKKTITSLSNWTSPKFLLKRRGL